MAHVYHWRHGWVPLDHEAALKKTRGNHDAAKRMLTDARSPEAGMHSGRHVVHAAKTVHEVHPADRPDAVRQVRQAADRHGVDLPGRDGGGGGNHYTDTMMPVQNVHRSMTDQNYRPSGPEWDALVADVRKNGVKKHLMVEETNRGSILGDGRHRLLAAEEAGITHVPVRTYANTPEGRRAANRAMADPGSAPPFGGRRSSNVSPLGDKRDERATQTPRQIHDRLQADPSKVSDAELSRLSNLGGRFAPAARAEQAKRDAAKTKASGASEHAQALGGLHQLSDANLKAHIAMHGASSGPGKRAQAELDKRAAAATPSRASVSEFRGLTDANLKAHIAMHGASSGPGKRAKAELDRRRTRKG